MLQVLHVLQVLDNHQVFIKIPLITFEKHKAAAAAAVAADFADPSLLQCEGGGLQCACNHSFF